MYLYLNLYVLHEKEKIMMFKSNSISTCSLDVLLYGALLHLETEPAVTEEVVLLLRLQVVDDHVTQVPGRRHSRVVVPDLDFPELAEVDVVGDGEHVAAVSLERPRLRHVLTGRLAILAMETNTNMGRCA